MKPRYNKVWSASTPLSTGMSLQHTVTTVSMLTGFCCCEVYAMRKVSSHFEHYGMMFTKCKTALNKLLLDDNVSRWHYGKTESINILEKLSAENGMLSDFGDGKVGSLEMVYALQESHVDRTGCLHLLSGVKS